MKICVGMNHLKAHKHISTVRKNQKMGIENIGIAEMIEELRLLEVIKEIGLSKVVEVLSEE